MNQVELRCFEVLGKLFVSNNTNQKGREFVGEVSSLLGDSDQAVVQKAHQWLSERPYALDVELEVARAMLHTFSKQGLDRTSTFRRFDVKLQALGY